MEPGLLLLLLLAAPWGQGWAALGHASEEETEKTDDPSVRPVEPGKCHETSVTTSTCNNACSSKCPGCTSCGQECQQEKEDRRIRPYPTTNCVNKCRDHIYCGGNRKCCLIRCWFRCPQPVPARPDTYPEKKVPHTICCCNSTCSSDTDCPNHLRCCPPPCRSPRTNVIVTVLNLGCSKFSYPRKLCYLPPEQGACNKYPYRYCFNSKLGLCQPFLYKGCGGNVSNFRTLEECRRLCQHGLHKR